MHLISVEVEVGVEKEGKTGKKKSKVNREKLIYFFSVPLRVIGPGFPG